MDFLKQNTWIMIIVLLLAVSIAAYSGYKSFQGQPASAPLVPHGPAQTPPG